MPTPLTETGKAKTGDESTSFRKIHSAVGSVSAKSKSRSLLAGSVRTSPLECFVPTSSSCSGISVATHHPGLHASACHLKPMGSLPIKGRLPEPFCRTVSCFDEGDCNIKEMFWTQATRREDWHYHEFSKRQARWHPGYPNHDPILVHISHCSGCLPGSDDAESS
ncbi:hypothetical protein VTI74DRAFT_4230 [Chaetomium olivicolor]